MGTEAAALEDGHEPFEYLISYVEADKEWATWVASVLHSSERTVRLHAWDAVPGTNLVVWINTQMRLAHRTIAICSAAYFSSPRMPGEWAGAADSGKLIPIRVEECEPLGTLSVLVFCDLYDVSEEVAVQRLREATGIAKTRRVSSGFPGGRDRRRASNRASPVASPDPSVGNVSLRSHAPAGSGRRPPGAVRVRDVQPRLLGVHATIRVEPAGDELPAYVPRDLDPDVREEVGAAAKRGGFVILVGGFSAGKTRTLYEAVREVLPDWWLLHPADVDAISAFAAAPMPRTVLWLDDLSRFLGSPQLPAVVRELAAAGVLLVGTLWQGTYSDRIVPADGEVPDFHPHDRELLLLARHLHVSDAFTRDERRRAEGFAADPRIRTALDAGDFGVTQVLAGAPQLVGRWNYADPYSRAVLSAAVDATRLGVQSPLSPHLLRTAAPGYCTPAEQAQAKNDWYERAIEYTTHLLLGAVAALTAVSDGLSMGSAAGLRIANYLLQHVGSERSLCCPPASFWDACISHLPDKSDLERIGHAADTRMRYRYAIPLLRRAGNRDPYLTERLGWLLLDQGKISEGIAVFRILATTDPLMAARLPKICDGMDEFQDILQDDPPEEARTRMLKGLDGSRRLRDQLADKPVAVQDDLLLTIFGVTDLSELRDRARNGDVNASIRLVDLLAVHGNFDEALPILRTLVAGGVPFADTRLIAALVEVDRAKEAFRLARFGLTAEGDVDTAPVPDNPLFPASI